MSDKPTMSDKTKEKEELRYAIIEGLESIGASIQGLYIHVEGAKVSLQGVLTFEGDEDE